MSKRDMNIERIIELIEKFYDDTESTEDSSGKKGRPRKFSDKVIVTLGVIKKLLGLSLRKTLRLSSAYLDELPSLRAFHYRLSKLEGIVDSLVDRIRDELRG